MNLSQVVLEQSKCPLQFLEEEGKSTETAWVFFDELIVDELKETANNKPEDGNILMLSWEASSTHPRESICLRARTANGKAKWYEVVQIVSPNIAFIKPAIDPTVIYFIKR